MVSICRGAPFLLPTDVAKAMPSRMPETQADKNATAMMGHPTRQIQQGPVGCPTCGHAHRAGTLCSKSVDVLDGLFKGVVTISGQKRGNPYRDDGTGRFAASPNGGGAGGGGGGASTQENTVMGAAPRAPGGLGTAKTEQGPASAAPAAAPSPPAAGGTMPGKAPQNAAGISPSMIARHEDQQKQDQGFMDALMKKPQVASAPKPVFSHEGAQNAYQSAKDQAMGSGMNNDQAHAAGMKAGGEAYSNAIRDPNAASAHGPTQSPPTRSAMGVLPGQGATQQGGAMTAQAPAPSMTGQGAAPAPSVPGGGGSQPAASPGLKAPGAGGGAAMPGQKKPGAGGQKKDLLDELSKPWAANAGGMGGGLFTPGGTVGATNAAATGSAHGLLNYAKEEKPAAAQHQQKVQNAQKQSGFLANQQTKHLNGMRQFAGQAGGPRPGGSGMGGGTP